jgi:hypothetical protein
MSVVRSHIDPYKRAENGNPFAHTNFKGADSPYLKVENDGFRFAPRMKRSPRVSFKELFAVHSVHSIHIMNKKFIYGFTVKNFLSYLPSELGAYPMHPTTDELRGLFWKTHGRIC